MDAHSESIVQDLKNLVVSPTAFRSILILIIALILAYWLSRFVARGLIFIAQKIGRRSDKESDETRVTRLRQTETYLSIAIAIIRALIVAVVGYVAWQLLYPSSSSNASASGLAAIGTGAIFALVAGQTIGIVLRDLTAGAIMISEGWYKIGDYVKLEPFSNLSGVVERFTLTSTRIRSLNGESVTVHNQNITGARITPSGVRTIAVEIFIRDKQAGISAIKRVIEAIPKGPTMLAQPLHITNVDKWGDSRWRVTVTGQTPPDREWLIDQFFVDAVNSIDDGRADDEKILSLPPIPHNADETANRRFKRAVRAKKARKNIDEGLADEN